MIASLPSGSPPEWRFHEGESLAREFPAGAAVRFSAEFPRGRVLQDFLGNVLDLMIVSRRVRETIEPFGIQGAEYLPVEVRDHKNAVVAPDYAILNLLGGQDAIDMKRSKYAMKSIDKEQIASIEELHLDRTKIAADAKMFRASAMRRLVLVREDVREALEKARLTGYATFPADGWDGFDI